MALVIAFPKQVTMFLDKPLNVDLDKVKIELQPDTPTKSMEDAASRRTTSMKSLRRQEIREEPQSDKSGAQTADLSHRRQPAVFVVS